MSQNELNSIKNPLRREGTSQQQRKLPALEPDTVKIDDRTVQDFLVYANAFARQVYYYNTANVPDGDWQDFFVYDISFIIASIEKTNPQREKDAFNKLLKAEPSLEGLDQLFQNIFSLAQKLNDWYVNLPKGNDLKDVVARMTRSNLEGFLSTILAYQRQAYKEFGNDGYPDHDLSCYDYLYKSGIWNLDDPNKIEASLKFFKPLWEPASDSLMPPNPSDEEKLKIGYGKLNKEFTELYNVYFQVIRSASNSFRKSLQLSDHSPHIALFISFLHLYKKVQDDLNKIPDKHLNYYYKDVLGLKLKPAMPDRVHLYFTLAKHKKEHKLVKGTRFQAGKDALGANVYYSLEDDTVLNKASVEKIKTIFVEREKKVDESTEFKNIYVAPVANSKDGKGAEIEDTEKPSWPTFGSNLMPKADVGFAIASNELLLAEGLRTITLTISYEGNVIGADKTLALKAQLSGEKGWIEPESNLEIQSNTPLTLQITLNPEEPAIVGFNEKIVGEKLGTTLPVMKIMMEQANTDNGNETLDLLKDIKITNLLLDISVAGAKELLAYNDLSLLDTQKSFFPFGVSPVEGSSFYVGSKEAFHKNLQTITFKVDWEGLPALFSNHYKAYNLENLGDDNTLTADDFKVHIYNLKKGNENASTPVAPDETLFNDTSIGSETDPIGNIFDFDEINQYGQNSKEGVIKLSLLRDFEHDQYPNVLSTQVLAAAWLPEDKRLNGAYYENDSGDIYQWGVDGTVKASAKYVIMPNEPYTPTIKSISIDYTSKVSINEANKSQDNTLFYHLHPFENAYEQFKEIVNVKVNDDVTDYITLLPQLHLHKKFLTADKKQNLEGCLMLGITELKPRQSLSILFQVAENTADAEVELAKVKWQYLADNIWHDFKEYEITNETTNGFITSGIVTFAVPDKINQKNTILSDQFHWIRAWVKENSGAVCEMINIHAQAVQVTFQDNKNDASFLSTPLPVETISKLEKDDSAIDSITQGYESFGGRPTESPINFYTRVSERLRHKGRAITLYDYERLVLEQFNDIYKVKCINHTNKNNQLAPGHVQVAVIPDFTKMKDVDRRQPKVTLSRLEEIRKFLEARNSVFVSTFNINNKYLHVVNPKYKRLKVDFNVKFNEDITAFEFYKRELKQAIIKFLSPWAYDDVAELNFGGKVFKSSIQGFVEKQSYVDYVTDFKMMDSIDAIDVNFIEADTARTILVPDEEDEFKISEASACLTQNSISKDTLGYVSIE